MSRPKFAQVRSTTLSTSVVNTETSAIILKNLVDVYGNALAMSDFGDIIYLTINPGSTIEEIISATDFTVNADATVTIDTGIVRGLAAKSPYSTGGTAQNHPAGTPIIVSNNPQIYEAILAYMVNLYDAQTVAGVKTFSSIPKTSAGNPIAAEDLARKAYVDSVVAGIATTINVIVPGSAGENVAAGNLIYFDDTDNEWKLCDADTAATVENVDLGIAQGVGVNGGAISGGVLVRGLDSNQSGLTPGAIYYASNSAGGLSSSAGTKEVTIGFAYSATQVYFNPRFNQQITEDQKDALVGQSGTAPSTANKFIDNAMVTEAKTVSKIPIRDANGDILVTTIPTATDACTSKHYVDFHHVTILDAASATLKFSNDAACTGVTDVAYTLKKEITLNEDLGSVRVSFDATYNSGGGGDVVRYRLYKNGVAIGTERTGGNNTYTTYTEDFTDFVSGDKIQIYAYRVSGTAGAENCKNFRLLFDKTATKLGNYTLITPLPLTFTVQPTASL